MLGSMDFTLRSISSQCTLLMNHAAKQYGLLRSFHVKGRMPCLIKAVQGISKTGEKRSRLLDYGHRYGEDSWFISSTPKAETMGVADGVGSRRKLCIDSGTFAQNLMSGCCEFSERRDYDGSNPRQLLMDSFDKLKKGPTRVCGSSTACLVTFYRSTCTLHSANLGNSGFMVLRNGRVLHRSPEQLHGFNSPYQLVVPPESEMEHLLSDSPEQADTTQLNLQPGDLVLLGTDGLFDNVPESILLYRLRGLHGEMRQQNLQQAVDDLVAIAKNISQSSTFRSPFSLKARAHNMKYGEGGKPDDITVILASVDVPNRK